MTNESINLRKDYIDLLLSNNQQFIAFMREREELRNEIYAMEAENLKLKGEIRILTAELEYVKRYPNM